MTLLGQSEPGATVSWNRTGQSTIADESGSFQLEEIALTPGRHNYSYTTIDLAGNETTVEMAITRDVSLTLNESVYVSEIDFAVELGPSMGRRVVSFDVATYFDNSDASPAVEDVFLLYLLDATDPTQTLLQRRRIGHGAVHAFGPSN